MIGCGSSSIDDLMAAAGDRTRVVGGQKGPAIRRKAVLDQKTGGRGLSVIRDKLFSNLREAFE